MSSAEIHPSRWRAGRNGSTVTLVVIHTSEGSYGPTSAEALKRWMGTDTSSSGNVASYHAVADTDSVADCVSPEDRAFGAGGVNYRALHLCVAGKSAQIPWTDWLASSGGKAAVALVARWCRDFGLPATKLAPSAVKAGETDPSVRGICGHGDVSALYPASMGHTDPGDRFPWFTFVRAVEALLPPPIPPQPPVNPTEDAVFWKVIDHPEYQGLAVVFAEPMPDVFVHIGPSKAAEYATRAGTTANVWAESQPKYPGGWAALKPKFFPRA